MSEDTNVKAGAGTQSAPNDGSVFSLDHPTIEEAAIRIDDFFEQYSRDGKAGTYSRNLRTYLANLLNETIEKQNTPNERRV